MLWPTPDAAVSNDGEEIASFTARRARLKARGINGNGMGTPLAMAAKAWPTPTSRDFKAGGDTRERSNGPMLTDAVLSFAGGMPLAAQASHWATPTAHDARRPGADLTSAQRGNLSRDAALWASPRAEMARALGNPAHITPRRGNGNIEDQTAAFSLPAPATSTDGETSSHVRRSLNPLFVEWLMGWPPGWTWLALTPPASTGCACSATALCRWRRRMRSALSSLASPPAALPAQLSWLE